jgi:hypothetical protein
MKHLGLLALSLASVAALLSSCTGDDDSARASGGSGGSTTVWPDVGGEAGAPPASLDDCKTICAATAAVDCSSGTPEPFSGEAGGGNYAAKDPDACVQGLCTVNLQEPTRLCQREWNAYLACAASYGSDAYTCYDTMSPILAGDTCLYPQLEDYLNCANSP